MTLCSATATKTIEYVLGSDADKVGPDQDYNLYTRAVPGMAYTAHNISQPWTNTKVLPHP